MKQKILGVFFALMLLGKIGVNAQTTTTVIDYTNAAGNYLQTDTCNVFERSSNRVVGGRSHRPASGGVGYDATKLIMKTSALSLASNSYNKGTSFCIDFPFKVDYDYTISIELGYRSTPASTKPKISMNLWKAANIPTTTTTGSSVTTCGPVDVNKYSVLMNALTVGSPFILNDTNRTTYGSSTLPLFSVPVQYDVLAITAFPFSDGDCKVYVYKITITERPSRLFDIVPANVTMPCGTETPVTFKILNNRNTPNVVSYTWNLGSAGNGWKLSDGSPAPVSVTTYADSLKLIPECGKKLNHISATIQANGKTYNAFNSALITQTRQPVSIVGTTSLCSGNTDYALNGLVCNAEAEWSIAPAGLGVLSNAGTTTPTLSYLSGSGNAIINARVISCADTQTVSTQVHLGPYTSTDFSLSGNGGSMYWCPNQTLSLGVSGAVSGSNYNWTLPTAWTLVTGGNTNYVVAKAPSSSYPPTGTFTVSFLEPCGSSITLNKFMAYSSSACAAANPYTLSPNPASAYLTIACASLQSYCNIAAVQITDPYGNVMSSQSWSYTNQQVQIPVYFLQNGNYIARVYSGSQWYSMPFIVQH